MPSGIDDVSINILSLLPELFNPRTIFRCVNPTVGHNLHPSSSFNAIDRASSAAAMKRPFSASSFAVSLSNIRSFCRPAKGLLYDLLLLLLLLLPLLPLLLSSTTTSSSSSFSFSFLDTRSFVDLESPADKKVSSSVHYLSFINDESRC
jgi:hypothetical protein